MVLQPSNLSYIISGTDVLEVENTREDRRYPYLVRIAKLILTDEARTKD